jgi:hypothetical protein
MILRRKPKAKPAGNARAGKSLFKNAINRMIASLNGAMLEAARARKRKKTLWQSL